LAKDNDNQPFAALLKALLICIVA